MSDSDCLVQAMVVWIYGWIENDGIGSRGRMVEHYATLKDLHVGLDEMTYGDDGGLDFKFGTCRGRRIGGPMPFHDELSMLDIALLIALGGWMDGIRTKGLGRRNLRISEEIIMDIASTKSCGSWSRHPLGHCKGGPSN